MSNIKEEAQVCLRCMHEMQTSKDCYVQTKRKFCGIEIIEKKEVNIDPEKIFGLIFIKRDQTLRESARKRKMDRRFRC